MTVIQSFKKLLHIVAEDNRKRLEVKIDESFNRSTDHLYESYTRQSAKEKYDFLNAKYFRKYGITYQPRI